MRNTEAFRAMLNGDGCSVAVGAFDAFSALMVEQAGFDAVYIGSYATEATMLGLPDMALMSRSERLLIARHVVKAVSVPVVVDAEEGYGNAISVRDTVQEMESIGVAAIHLDDEEMPSKCPFLPGIPRNQLISVEEMCGKIEAAVDAREDQDFSIIARSDVIGTVDREEYYRDNLMEEVVRRSNEYVKAGADAIFVMALTDEELNYFRERITGPLVGVFAPAEPLPISSFRTAKYSVTIGSVFGLYAAAKGLRDGLALLKETEDWNATASSIIDDEEFFEIIGISRFGELYDKYHVK